MRLLLVALAAAVALVVAELAAGGLGFGGEHVRDPCEPRPALPGAGVDETAQRFVLRGLDLAACHVGESREQLVLDLAGRGVALGDLAARLEGRLGGVLDWIAGALRKVER